MQLTLDLEIPVLPEPINYQDRILLTGSCFTEHMAERMSQNKFNILSNPNGILFNPLNVAQSLKSYIAEKEYTRSDLFQLNELWNSWDHHTRFSDIDPDTALKKINVSQAQASAMIKEAGWIIITLGSAFQYYLQKDERPVANNHRAPAQWFEKRLLSIEAITDVLSSCVESIIGINPSVKFLYTISPVRHIRDGVVNNNRSKARLIEAVHELAQRHKQVFYFPAYELVIDVLRDYRFYDLDYVHPNYQATQYVWERFVAACIDSNIKQLMEQVQEIVTARGHKPRFPGTEGHKKFRQSYLEKINTLMIKHPYINLKEEREYFS